MMIKTWIKQAEIEEVDAFFHVNNIEKDVDERGQGDKPGLYAGLS